MSSIELELIPAIILPQYVLSPKRYVLIRILPEGAKSNALYQNPATISLFEKSDMSSFEFELISAMSKPKGRCRSLSIKIPAQ